MNPDLVEALLLFLDSLALLAGMLLLLGKLI